MTYLFWGKDKLEGAVYQRIMYEHDYILKVRILNIEMTAKVWAGRSYIKLIQKLFVKYRLFIVSEGASYIGPHEKSNLSFNNVF
jgi:hypothetical protein